MRRLLILLALTSALRAAPPNILLIFADDLGYSDVGVFGARSIRTPNLDRLAAEGARLTAHLVASPVCSPSRAGLLTGRYPQRTGIVGVLRDHHDATGLDLDERTIADELSAAGYETALIGKWHLGIPEPYRPLRRGFAHAFGFLSGTIDYYSHLSRGGGRKGLPVLSRDGKPFESEGYFPDRLADEVVRYLVAPHERPFFLFYSLGLPHTPLQAPPDSQARGDAAVYRAMVERLDRNVGRALEALESSGLAENTLVVFLSDHGWDARRKGGPGSNRPFRGGKYELTEGGLRTPTLVRWPGRIPAGRTLDEPSIALDWFPTFLEAAQVTAPSQNPLDGVSLIGYLTGGDAPPPRTLFWAFRDDLTGTPASYAARRGRWKFLRVGDHEALYNLDEDPGEVRDLSGRQAEIFHALRDAADRWRAAVGEPRWISKPPAPAAP
ncbi:MAG: sulfatase-like hydrolase/transferase [Bryobacterales bacterium]|nr:sulfatase-like hydrolase/transferase [Bryobacterales bacterium]